MIAVIIAASARLSGSALARRVLGGATWSVLGSVGSSAVTLLMLMLVARILGKEVYGQFVVIQSTLSMIGVFAGFGIGIAATRYAAEFRMSGTERLGHILTLAERTILCFGLLASTGMLFASGWMANHIFNAPNLSGPLAISACAVLFMAMDGYQKSVLIGFESMRAFAIGSMTSVIAGFPIMLLSANEFGMRGAASAILVNAMLQAAISRYQMTRELRKYKIHRGAKGCLSEWPVLWQFAFPALLSGALVSPAHWVAQTFLANTKNGYVEMAVLGVSMQWFNVTMVLPSAAGRVVLPILTDHVTKNDHRQSRKILLYAMGGNAILVVPMAALFCLFSPSIMSMYGSGFEQDNKPLVLAVCIAALLAIQTPAGYLLAASSRMWLGALMNAGWALIYVGLAYFLAKNGARGIMIALGVAYTAHTIWNVLFTAKEMKVRSRI
jgi:O-antigen/teichoic acid export membrane protein